jgi:hypothetical protein
MASPQIRKPVHIENSIRSVAICSCVSDSLRTFPSPARAMLGRREPEHPNKEEMNERLLGRALVPAGYRTQPRAIRLNFAQCRPTPSSGWIPVYFRLRSSFVQPCIPVQNDRHRCSICLPYFRVDQEFLAVPPNVIHEHII